MPITLSPYPDFQPAIFETRFPKPISQIEVPASIHALLTLEADTPVERSEETRNLVRDLLRHRGYKPTGRGKPASEYLVKAAGNDKLNPINPPVDICNVVSLHSGLPISVVDLDCTEGDLHIQPGEAESKYVFNTSGQEISVAGLLCLHDALGPCANSVKDSQRTKTSDTTTRTLSIIWAPEALADLTQKTLSWYTELLAKLGASTEIWHP